MKLFTHLRHRLLCRLMAAAMVVTSVPPPPAWAAETLSDLPDLRELAVPETLGYLSEVWQPEDGPPQGIVVHIRDLHVHPEAQRHAGELIGALRERYGAELIAVEGAAGECDTTLYSDFPDPPSTGRIARLFLEEGLLTGAEYYGITHPGQVTLWGVEDAPLYDRHLSVYHRNAEDAPPFRETLTQLTAMLEALHDGIYPEPLKQLLRAKAQFDASELTFIGYVKQLTALAVEHQISSSTYPALRSLADASAKPDPAALLAEAGALAAVLEERLLATDEQRQLARLTRWHALAQALVESQLQPEEWDRFDTLSRALSAGAVQHFLSEHRDRLGQPLPEQLQSGLSALFDGLPRHEEFYTVAHQRDDAFVRNTLDEMRRRHATAAVLVAGGFHTPGITARLRAQRIAYAVIVPAFRSGDTDEALYRARLNNEIPSLQQLITRLDSQALAPPLATAPPAGGGERSDDGRKPTGDQSPKRQDEDSPSAEKHRQTFSRWVGAQAHELLTRVQGGTEKLRQWIADHPRETGLYGIALTAAGTKLVLSVLGTDLPFDDAGTLLAMAPVAAGGMTPESRRLVEAIQETIREEGFDASEEVFVFGSYANGNTHAESDVDLSIPDGGGSPLQARRMVRLLTALKKKGYRFDHDPFWFDEEALLAVLQPRRYIAVSRDGYRFVDRAAERDPGTAPTEDQIRSWMHARTPVRLEWIDLRQKAHASATGYLEQFTTPGGLTGVRFSGSSRDIPVQDIVSAVPAAASGITARRTPGSPTALEQQLDYLAQAQAAFDRGDRTGAARLVSWVIGDHQDEEGPLLGLQRLAADEALSEELRQDAGAALARALNLRERIAAAQAQPQVTKPPTPFGRSLTSLAMGGAYVPQVRAEFATPGRYDEQTAQIARHSSPLEYAWFLKALDQHVGSLDGISVLEAGAGPGAMVERMRAHGLDVRGVEANQDFVAFAQHAGVPLIQGDFFSVPEALAGQTFRLTFSNLFLDALQRSESAPDGSVERRPATHEETLQVLATIAALTMMGGLSIHRIHPGNRLSVTDDELARAGFAVESSDPLRGLLVLRRTALPVPSATAEESAEPERLERFLEEAGVPPGTAPISFSPKNTIWAGRDGRSIVKVFHDFDYGAQRYANEVLYHQPGYNPYPVPIMARDDRLRAIAFDNMRAEGAGLMADALVGARTLDQLVATITAAAGGLARHHARRFETFGWLGRDGPRPVRLNDLQDPSAQRYTSYFEFLFPSMQERLQRLREAGAEPPEEARFLAWAGTVDADRQYVLNHADYNPWNVFLNSSGSIRAVIDGEWIRSGPASRDVAVALVRLLDLSIGHPLLMEHLDAVTGTFLREYRRQAEPLGLDMDALEAALPFHMAYDLVTGAGYQWFDVGDRAKARWLLSLATFYIQRRSIDADRVFPSEDVVFTYRAPDGRTDHQVDVAGTFTQRASQWELSPLRWDPVTGFYQSAPMRLPLGQYEYRFVVDHQWMADPNPHAPRAGDHSLLQVEETHGAEVVHRALAGHLASIHRDGKRPLLSIDLDDTLLPYLANATEETLSVLQAYLQAGGELAFNTLTQRHWLYARLLDELANRLSREGRLGLLAQVSLIVGLEDGRHEIYAWDGEGYRRIDQYQNSKGESLVRLLRHLDGEPVAVLAGYGDAFLDLRSDGSLTGRPEVPLAVNVGKSVPVPPGPTEFINSSRKGPAATLEDIRFATAWLRQHPVPAREAKPVPSAPSEVEWSIESPNPLPVAGEASVRIRAGRPGFVWSWTTGGEPGQGPYLVPLIEAGPGIYAAHLPKSSDAFTFFFSDASTPPGRWLREERPGDPHDFFVVRTTPASSGPAAPPAGETSEAAQRGTPPVSRGEPLVEFVEQAGGAPLVLLRSPDDLARLSATDQGGVVLWDGKWWREGVDEGLHDVRWWPFKDVMTDIVAHMMAQGDFSVSSRETDDILAEVLHNAIEWGNDLQDGRRVILTWQRLPDRLVFHVYDEAARQADTDFSTPSLVPDRDRPGYGGTGRAISQMRARGILPHVGAVVRDGRRIGTDVSFVLFNLPPFPGEGEDVGRGAGGSAAPPADLGAAELEQLVLQHAPRIQPALTAVKPLGHELMVDVRNAQIDPDLRVVIAHSTFPGDGEGPYAVHNLFVINVHDGSVVAVASIPRYGQREIRNPFQITAHVAGEHYMQRAIVLLLVSGHLDAWYSSDTPSPPARAMYERMGREEPRVSVQPTGRGGYRVTRAGATEQPMAIPALGGGAAIGLLGGGLVFGGLLVAAWFKQDLLRYADTKAPPLLRRLMAPVRHLPDLRADADRFSAWLWATPAASAVIRRLIRLDNRLDPWRGWIRITVHGTIVATTAFSVAPALLGAGVGIGLPLAMYVVGALVVGVLPAADYLSEGRAQQKRWPVWRVALTALTIAAGAAARVYISLAPVRLLPRVVRPGAELYQNGRHRAAYALMVSAAFMAGAYHFPAFFLYSVYLDPAAWADLALTVQGVSSALLIKSQWPSRVVPTATVPAQPSIGFPGPVPIAEHPWNRAQQQTAYFSHLNRYTNQMRQLRDDWLPRMVARQLARGDRRLRISVLGPATGEEAASIAATVLDAFEAHPDWGGIETWDVRVTGIERNPDAAAEARRRLTGQSPFAFMPEVPVPAGPPMHAGAPGKARWVQDLLNRHAAWVASHIEILEGSAESAEMLSALGGSDVIFVNATLGGLAPEDYERVAAAIRQGAPQAMVVGTRDELFDQLGSAYRIADRPTANFESSYHVAEPVAPSVSRDGASTRGVIEGLVDFDRLADPETAVPDALRPVVARYVEYMFGHVGAAPASAPPLELFDSSRSPWAAVSSEEHWSRLEGRPLFHLREDEVAVMDQAAFDQAAFDADECLSGCDYLALRFATPQRTSFAVVHFSQPEDYRLRGLLLELFRTRPAGSRVQGIMFRKRAGGYTSAVIRQLEREGALTPGAVEDRTYVSRAGAPANALVVPEGLIHIEYRLNPDVRLTAEGLRHQLATEPVASAAFYRFPWAEAADAGPSPAAPPADALPAPLSEEDASQLLTVMSAILTGSDGVTRRHTFNVRGRSYGFELGWGSRSARVGPLLFVMLDELMEPVRDPAEQAHGAPAGSQWAAELIARYQRRLGRLYTDHAANIVFVAPSVDVPGESLNEYTAHMVAEMLGRAEAFAGTDVEDAGAGRGFLSVVALRLGARHVTLRDDSAELLAIARLVLQAQGWREGIHFRLAQEDITQPSSAPDDPAHEPTIGLANIGPWPHYGHANHAIMGRWARRPAMRLVFNGGYYFGNAGHEQATANVIELLESNGFDVHVSADTGENDTAPAVLLIATRQPDAPPAAGMVETTTEALETLHRTERDP